jgi:hypothetical protein
VHLQDEAEGIYGNVLWVPSPLKTERWFPLVLEKPSEDIADYRRRLHNLSVERYTIDWLQNGTMFLSFAHKNDQLTAKMALSGL